MTRQRQRSRLGLPRGGDPACDPSDLHDVDHREITSSGSNGIRHPTGEPPVLAGLDKNRVNGLTNRTVALQIVGGDRFFNPGQIKLFQSQDSVDGAGCRLRLIEVDHQPELGSDQLPYGSDDCDVIRHVPTAELDLDRLETAFYRRLDPGKISFD